MYAVATPMSRGEARSVIFERGAVMYEKNTVYIYVPDKPTALELEAIAVLADTSSNIRLTATPLNQ